MTSSSNFSPARCFFLRHILRWEILWRNAPRFGRDFGSTLPFQTRLTKAKPVLPLSNEHGSQVKDQGRRQCCHNKHKKFPYRPTRDVSLRPGHVSQLRPEQDCADWHCTWCSLVPAVEWRVTVTHFMSFPVVLWNILPLNAMYFELINFVK